MESSKISALLFISMLFVSSVTPILGCNTCPNPPKKGGGGIKPPVKLPPIKLPPVKLPPVPVVGGGLPPIPVVGGGLPPVPVVGGGLPPIPVVGGGLPPIPVVGGGLPPVGGLLPPVGGVVPPVIGGGAPKTPCPSPPSTKPPPKTKPEKCPIDTLKLGACVDLLGGLVHIGLGDPNVNKCCPLLQGLAEIEAAACLCTTLKVKLLNLKIYVPLALQLLLTCGKSPPPGYTCSI